MIGITKLWCGQVTEGDVLRYERGATPAHLLQFATEKKPIVVWNSTRRCNLNCIHCYIDARDRDYPGELTTAEARKMIASVAEYKAPVLLFSGGEPLLRPDLFELMPYAKELGLRVVISTNGILITPKIAERIKSVGVSYVGISLDGVGEVNDRFRGKKGAFDEALAGFRACVAAGQKVGLRLTLTQSNLDNLNNIFDLIDRENIPRACFYHLVYSGRGGKLQEQDLAHQQTRRAVDLIIERTVQLQAKGKDVDILTVDNHTDGVYLYLKLLDKDPARAAEVLKLLQRNGGNQSGIAIADIDNEGNVHPDQFLMSINLGNIRDRSFTEIWTDPDNAELQKFKSRRALLKGKCGRCVWQDICNGNFRARALALTGDLWAEDPACYLTEAEITTRREP